jgi:mono/diheme cytochrome c family protein
VSASVQSLFAKYEQDGPVNGYVVYQKKCQMCHVERMNKNEALKKFKTLKAPPMNEVSARMKENILTKGDDEEVLRELRLTFMRDYIINPSIDKSMCHMGALDKFDVMPSQKGKLTDAELHAVTEWVLDNYEGTVFK